MQNKARLEDKCPGCHSRAAPVAQRHGQVADGTEAQVTVRKAAFPGPGWVPHSLPRVNQLLSDIVEEVPAAEGKGALEKGQGQVTHGGCHPEVEGIAGLQLLEVSWGRGPEVKGQRCLPSPGHSPTPALPWKIWTKPMPMMSDRASNLPPVKMSCMRVAQRTLELFTHVSSTGEERRAGGCVPLTGATAKSSLSCRRMPPHPPQQHLGCEQPHPEADLSGAGSDFVPQPSGTWQGAERPSPAPRRALTQAGHGEHTGSHSRGDAVGKHGLQYVVGEGHGDDGQAGGVHDEDSAPEQQEAGISGGTSGTGISLPSQPRRVEWGCTLGPENPKAGASAGGQLQSKEAGLTLWTVSTETVFSTVQQRGAALGQALRRTEEPSACFLCWVGCPGTCSHSSACSSQQSPVAADGCLSCDALRDGTLPRALGGVGEYFMSLQPKPRLCRVST